MNASGRYVFPGVIDAHVHYPQTDIIASPSEGLLPWLERYTFPMERRFGDPDYAAEVARFFLDELQRCGTTTALVYCTVHAASAEAFFTESHARNLRMVAGKVLMDRNCPEFLRDTAESGARDSEALIQRWHGKGRQMVALTPRFAPTSTEAHERVLRLAALIAPEVWREVGTIPWYGAEYSLDDLVVYQQYGHKREHDPQLQAVLAKEGAY